jgi:hypothetical protein
VIAVAMLPVIALGCAWPQAVFAAHPLQTEDTGTQGVGNVEFENGLALVNAPGDARAFSYQPQLSYGLLPTLDLIVQPSWLGSRGSDGHYVSGWGDTNLDAKWRFFGRAPWSLAIRAGAQLATSEHDQGLPAATVSTHELLVATYDEAPFTLHANVGDTQNPASSGLRSAVAHVSSALMWAASERLVLTVDGGAGSDPDRAQKSWPATLLSGLIYTIQPGLDADFGYQSSIGDAQITRQWLAGITYRFSP